MAQRYHIAIFAAAWNGYHRTLLRGIGRYVQTCGRWSVCMPDMADRSAAMDLGAWSVDGILVAGRPAAGLRADLPAVSFRSDDAVAWRVVPDWQRVGRLAATHLDACGVERLAFFGEDQPYTEPRWQGFSTAAEQLGHTPQRGGLGGRSRSWQQRIATITAWLCGLTPPVGVLAANDELARHLVEAAGMAGLRVPDEIAVLGMHNIPEICAMAAPALSSIDTNGEHIGYTGAKMLDALLGGRDLAEPARHIQPRRVVERGSTGRVVANDPAVRAAVDFIRARACRPISADDVARAAHLSRRALELRFAKAVGITPAKLILQHQLREARRRLAETDQPMSVIAAACGFRDAAGLSKIFAREQGVPPSAYRRLIRSEPDDDPMDHHR